MSDMREKEQTNKQTLDDEFHVFFATVFCATSLQP